MIAPLNGFGHVWAQAAGTGRLPRLFPPALRESGPQGLAWWQWLTAALFLAVGILLGRLLGALTKRLLHRLARRTATTVDERWIQSISPALTACWATAIVRLLLPWLELGEAAHRLAATWIGAASVVAVFWLLWRSIDTVVELVIERSWAAGNASARSMLMVGGNLLKAGIMVTGAVSTAAAFGYPVTTVVAGLGIGGIAFAFGAQKTVENLFGSIALAADQPFRVGDLVKVEDVVGNVEHIGTRSSRIRTADRTIVTIPNGRLADARIESFAPRDRLRLGTTITLAYDTTEPQVRQVLGGIEHVMRAHPLVWPEVVVAKLANLGTTTIDIEILCWFQTTDYDAFRAARQDVLLGIMRVVEDAGARFAQLPPAPPTLAV